MKRAEIDLNGKAAVGLWFNEDEKPDKPAFGDPCNRCGVCCLATQCEVSKARFGKQTLCPALELDGGKYNCGLMVNAKKYVPERVALFGKETMERLMKLISGDGSCSCKTQGSLPSVEALARSRAYDDSLDTREVRFAFIAWMMP